MYLYFRVWSTVKFCRIRYIFYVCTDRPVCPDLALSQPQDCAINSTRELCSSFLVGLWSPVKMVAVVLDHSEDAILVPPGTSAVSLVLWWLGSSLVRSRVNGVSCKTHFSKNVSTIHISRKFHVGTEPAEISIQCQQFPIFFLISWPWQDYGR